MNIFSSEAEVEKIVSFFKSTFKKAGFQFAVVGVSGGIDSAVVLALAVKALGPQNVTPMLMPYSTLGTNGVLDSVELIQKLGIPLKNIVRFDIKPMVDAVQRTDPFMNNVRKGNVMARTRMILLFDQAKKRNALVVGTENKSEHILGYFTRFGDAASDVEPIMHLYKTEVYELGRALEIPPKILEKAPSADLWPEQTDEREFGFTYKDADEILFRLIDEKKTKEEIIKEGFSTPIVETIVKRIEMNAFKHKTPHTIFS